MARPVPQPAPTGDSPLLPLCRTDYERAPRTSQHKPTSAYAIG